MTVLGLALALAVGLSLGLLGGGGSVLTVPIFVYVLGFEAKQAIAMSLVVVGTVSLVGAIGHWRAGRMDFRMAAIFGVTAIPLAYVGARLGTRLSGPVQLSLLALVICVAAVSMFRNASRPEVAATRAPHPLRLAPVGAGVGVLTGLVGVGGGFLIVPALVLFGNVPMPLAIGTSLLVIAANSAAGLVGYLGHVPMSWPTVGLFTGVAVIGILIGTQLCALISPARLKRGFAVLLLAVGAFMFFKTRAPKPAVAIEPSVVPSDSTIPHDSAGASIRRGLALIAHTHDSLPANAANALRCLSCHIDGGRRAGGAMLIGTYARYPRFIERKGAVASIEERINFCLTRSLAGQPLADSSRDMHDMIAYLAFLSTGIPRGAEVRGSGLPTLSPLTGDTTRGATLYGPQCSRCHGPVGEGTAMAPPLWGPRSFSVGASMAREGRAASFIRRAMPYDRPGTLTDQDAFDLAAYMLSHPRPDLAGKALDWPRGDAPYDVPYDTRGHVAYRPPPMLMAHYVH